MKIVRWEEYQTFFQLIILRYLVVWFSLVPVVAGIVSQLPDPLPVSFLGVQHEIELKLPFHWQLLWMSSLFFVLALAIYKVLCPKFVHKYNNFSDYCSYKHHPRWLAWEAHALLKIADEEQKKKLRDRFLEKKYISEVEQGVDHELCVEPTVGESQTKITFKVDEKAYEFSMPINKNDTAADSERDVFYEIFGRYSESRRHARLFIKIFLGISLVFFLIALGQHIFSGSAFVWAWASGIFNS